jgi:inosine-uridine nucleoside N-ribohydrolase
MKLLVDTDPAMGLLFRDIDDVLAIHLLYCAGVQLEGLSITYGNSSLDRTLGVAKKLGERFKIPVYSGASGPNHTDTEAVEKLASWKGDVLAIGPMTNIAAALKRGASWTSLTLLGGTSRRLPNLRPLHTTELNFALDEPAAAAALQASTRLVPMEVCRQVFFCPAELKRFPSWIQKQSRSWLALGPLMTGRNAVHPWDVVAAMSLIEPNLFTIERKAVVFRGRLGWRGYIGYGEGQLQEVLVGVNAEVLKARWFQLCTRVSV